MIDFARSDLYLAHLEDEIASLSAHIQAATYRLLKLIHEFDLSEGWYHQGFQTCASWLSWRTGITLSAAREKVRVARKLIELPELSAALERGELSYSLARAITRVATPETETDLVEMARHANTAQMERVVRGLRIVERCNEREGELERHESRALWVMPDEDGSWIIRGRLDPEIGAVLCKALEAAGESFRGGQPGRDESTAEQRRSDALGLVAEAALGKGLGARPEPAGEGESKDAGTKAQPVVGRAERFHVVVHVSAETLAGESAAITADHPAALAEAPRIEGGPNVSAETSRRLACDASMVEMIQDGEGNVLDVGRRRRTLSAALRRALDYRDRCCRFPGCRSRFCDAHHIEHWANGGETRLTNLLLLCRRHHRRVHEDGWRVTMDEAGEAQFHRSDGQVIPRLPERARMPEDPVADLTGRQRGLGIEPWTPTPDWCGDGLDLDHVLHALCERWRPEPHVSVGAIAVG